MVYDQERQVIVMFGGHNRASSSEETSDEHNVTLNDTWEFDGTNWHKVITPSVPEARVFHTMAYDPSRGVVVLLGGETDNGRVRDPWEYDGTNWYFISDPAIPLSGRSLPMMVYDPREEALILMAGATRCDVWQYDGQVWQELLECLPPPLRMPGFTQVIYDPQQALFVFTDGEGKTYHVDRFNDNDLGLHLSNIDQGSNRMEGNNSSRSSFTFVYDTRRKVAVLFGGRRFSRIEGTLNRAETMLNDTWEYDGESWYQVGTRRSPSPRYGHSMAYDEARGVMVLFGGLDIKGRLLNDTWEYDGTIWVQK
jgi:hypothetical protein